MVAKLIPLSFFSLLFVCIFGGFNLSEAHKAPAMYVFGDSLVDVGNNNHLIFSFNKANFPPHGIDFPDEEATGRFSNGKNSADFLAEKVGVPIPPPYLSLLSEHRNNSVKFQTGVNFASAGARIFNQTYHRILRQSISLTKQVDHFSDVHESLLQQIGHSGAHKLLPKSIFAIVIGSNDIYAFAQSSNLRSITTPAQYVKSMANELAKQIEHLYDYHARKFVIVGIGALGCTPSQRVKSESAECDVEVNIMSHMYHHALASQLKELQSKLKDFHYSYFNAYSATKHIIKEPAAYGFEEVKAACCGLGMLNAQVPCLPFTKYCPNRKEFVFWDADHPTEAVHRVLVDYMYNTSSAYTFPISVSKLIHV